MQSDNLAASVEILREFAEKCWQEGACEAQNDAAKYINEHTVNYRDIPNVTLLLYQQVSAPFGNAFAFTGYGFPGFCAFIRGSFS